MVIPEALEVKLGWNPGVDMRKQGAGIVYS